tara:strand:- start:290 stop:481 length:192 start_codon:yes stop_codon:yes gene_type:complete
MSNKFHTDIQGGASSPKMSGPGSKPGAKEKPAFPSADLPGKTQPKDRSGGVKKAQVSPKSTGL